VVYFKKINKKILNRKNQGKKATAMQWVQWTAGRAAPTHLLEICHSRSLSHPRLPEHSSNWTLPPTTVHRRRPALHYTLGSRARATDRRIPPTSLPIPASGSCSPPGPGSLDPTRLSDSKAERGGEAAMEYRRVKDQVNPMSRLAIAEASKV
jgi:hypothetical protein